MNLLHTFSNGLTQLIFPHTCLGCANDLLRKEDLLCTACFAQLPFTNFFEHSPNPIEKIFYGRLSIEHAAANLFFTKDSLLQQLMIQLKYRGNKDAGYYLGKLMGLSLNKSVFYQHIDAMIPLPLNAKKEFKRGYNQAQIICEGIATVWKKPILTNIVERPVFTETQTHENRIQRWKNMEGVFSIADSESLKNKHVLLVDDVITTGATLESCGTEILKVPSTKLSIATVAYTL